MSDQGILFVLLAVVFALLIWGRWRYDLVAFGALMVAVVAGVIPVNHAFSGFGHPAVVVIALVLIISAGLSHAGVIEWLARYLVVASRSLATHIGIMSGFAAALSAVMNNVAALALLMPLDMQAAVKSGRSPALSLMPLSFASILGGMITLIGTPPNIVIAEYRGTALGEPYRMFDFAPVGLAVAAVGVAYVALIGWRLIPGARGEHDTAKELFELESYVAEVTVPEGSPVIGKRVRELDDAAAEHGVGILGLVRRGARQPGTARRVEIRKNDVLVLSAAPGGIEGLVGALGLKYQRSKKNEGGRLSQRETALVEVVVPAGARIEGRSARSMRLMYRHGVSLLGVSRQGKRFTDRVRELEIKTGDILLLLGDPEQLEDIVSWLGVLPLAERGLQVTERGKAGLAVGIFAAAVLLASLGVVYLPVALGVAVVLMVLAGVVPLRKVYDSIEWPVIVLLGSMIPIGVALETSGGTALIASAISGASDSVSPVVVLAMLMIVTMTLSDVMNNVATAVIAAPIAVSVAGSLGVNPDAFLMGVAVAASCAFLTPIGHKNNTLVMGPGGYRFGDYWRMGLPLEIIVMLVAVPMILWVWPL
ncbi:MAG: anion permease [Gammaproteobacteria bacterium]|nr:anion permease [Gammaproteobacteria bacterium]MBT8051785.1 anion permease [Gammaproteobacteria bacterium]NNJ79749.1 SLC13 family permease [Xanthomonadales bacterium]